MTLTMSSDNEIILPVVNEENACLPLSINVVAKYWNIDLPVFEAEELAKKYPGLSGNVFIEGIELAERHGLSCKILDSSIGELKKILDTGIPPIVILPGIGQVTQHASIISGYDESEKTFFHYVPQASDEGIFQGAIPEDLLEKKWSEDGKIVILLAPTDVMASLNTDKDSKEKSFRYCFNSEREALQKNFNEAINFLKKAIKLDESNSTAYSLLGGMLNEQNSSDCVNYYQSAIKQNPSCYLAYRGLGNYYLKNENFAKAEEYYTKAIEVDAERFANIYKNRAFVREKQQKNSEAKDDLKTYLKLAPKAKDRGPIEQAIREL